MTFGLSSLCTPVHTIPLVLGVLTPVLIGVVHLTLPLRGAKVINVKIFCLFLDDSTEGNHLHVIILHSAFGNRSLSLRTLQIKMTKISHEENHKLLVKNYLQMNMCMFVVGASVDNLLIKFFATSIINT